MNKIEVMTGEEWNRKKREIEVLLTEYERDAAAARAWYAAWLSRNKGFRCKRKEPEPELPPADTEF